MLRLSFPLILFLIASCGGPGERIKDTESSRPSPTPTPSEREISGTFKVSGSFTNDSDPYDGILTIAPQGDIYSFRWTISRGSRIGVGVQIGNATAASFAAPGGGKDCGVVLYKVAADGTLEGRLAMWGNYNVGTEKATRIEGRGFAGKYEVSGSYAHPYKGTLTITKDGSGYIFDWELDGPEADDPSRVAFGTWHGSYAAASFGGRPCSFAMYDIQSNGNLDGRWGGQKAVTFGTETASRQ